MRPRLDEIFCISNKVIYSETSGEEYIEVCEDLECRWFHFGDNYIQSAISLTQPDKLVLPYTQTMMAALLFVPNPISVILLGMGGGGLARFLLHHFTDISIIGVENSSSVLRMAKNYFKLPAETEQFHVHVADALHFMKPDRCCFDLICVDIFKGGKIPREFHDKGFFVKCFNHLSGQGVCVINLIVDDEEEFKTILTEVRAAFNKNVLCASVKNYKNVILFAFKERPKDVAVSTLKKRAKALSESLECDLNAALEALTKDNVLPNSDKVPERLSDLWIE